MSQNTTFKNKKRPTNSGTQGNLASKGTATISRFFLPATNKRKRPLAETPSLNHATCPDEKTSSPSFDAGKTMERAGSRNNNEATSAASRKNPVIVLLDDDDDDYHNTDNDNDKNQVNDAVDVQVNDSNGFPQKPLHTSPSASIEPTTTTTTTTTATTTADIEGGGEPSSTSNNDKNNQSDNPFEKFAFRGSSSSQVKHDSLSSWVARSNKSSISKHPKIINDSKSTTTQRAATLEKGKFKNSKDIKKDWIRMKDLSTIEQEKIVEKWHSMVDPTASLEDRRFQLLVAARLHARCQDGPVRKAMKELRAIFAANNQNNVDNPPSKKDNSATLNNDSKRDTAAAPTSAATLTCSDMARADPELFVPAIQNLQYYNTKAKHLVQAAQEIQIRFGGQVPETEHLLKQITGLGPVLSDLLAFVNTRKRHKEREEQQRQQGEPNTCAD